MLPVHKKITQPNVSTQKRVTVSYIIRNERELKHRAGVNALQYDAALNRLFSAGRDSIIRTWDCRNLNNPYIYSLEHHTDWVNDIILCCGGKNLISASSDTTVKVWNAHKGFCMSTLRTHKDYVRALAYAKDLERVASAGLDKTIFIWDINTLTALTASNNTVTTSSLTGSKNSIYSLATNPSGTVVVSGSTEKILRVWDPRTCSKLMKLIGHSDNVRGLLVNRDGTQCLSGSSDGTIKLWSLGQQQCILTIRVHKEGVWTLAATDTFNHVISAGRDRKIYKTDLRNVSNSVLIGEEQNPVLRICPVPDFSGIWVSTDNSYLSYWSLNNPASGECNNNEGNARINNEPSAVIEGAPAIRKYYILNDKIHVLTQDSDDNVNVYDILQARKVEDLGKVDFDEQVKKRFKMIHVPTWFNIDLKTGYLTVHLGQEENDCFSAWIALKDTNYLDYEQKINYGCMILKALFKNWKYTRSDSEKEDNTNGEIVPYDIIEVPPHTPLIITDVGKTVYRVLVQDAGGQAETHMLNECVPEWVREVLIAKKAPKQLKISFFLQPIDDVYAKNTRNYYVYKERLVANDYIQVHKIIEHVYNKLSGMEGGPVNAQAPNEKFNMTNDNKELLGSIEIICNDQVLDPEMELRAVKQHIWKSSSDLTLLYRAVKCNANNSHKS